MIDDFVFGKVSGPGGSWDLLFVHGLTGDPLSTWTNSSSTEPEGGFWPLWIAKDIPSSNIYTLGYQASIFARWAKKESALHEQAYETLEFLAGNDIGTRPIAIVAHSLGGLVAKQLLRSGMESDDDGWQKVAANVKQIIFLATPHSGSSLSDILKFFAPGIVSD
ncbi:MAG TPA: hypothetical protein VN844_18645 [Pyrinomonadaceae bacterium]|nr:hypothetical protein [Pyrinomonadaceae bacterium]